MFKNKRNLLIIIVIVILCILLLSVKIEFKSETDSSKPLLEFLEHAELKIDDIMSVERVRYTEGGDSRVTYNEKGDIESLYNMIKNMKIGKETNRACEDNTTVYIFNVKDENKFKVEIECDWVVIGNKRYEIVKD